MEREYCGKLMEKWLYENNKRLAMSSAVKYRQLFYGYIEPYFQGISMTEMSGKILNEYKYSLVDMSGNNSKEGLSNENIKCIAMLLNRFLEHAYSQKMLSENMHMDIRLKKSRNEIHVFSDKEQESLEKHIWKHMDLSSGGIILCLYTGLRIGELCALKWSDFDMDKMILHINRTVQRLKISKDSPTSLFVSFPKTEASARAIPITGFIKSTFFPFSKGHGRDEYIFSGCKDRPLDPRTMQYRYKKLLSDVQIPYRKFHTLRHTFASRCIMRGMDAKTLSELLGHADVRTTLNYYCHTSMEYKREQLDLLTPPFAEVSLL